MTSAIKQRYFDKIYQNAKTIKCKCGCDTPILDKDKYGRSKTYVSGHNNKKYQDRSQYKREWNHRNRAYRYQLKKLAHRKKKVKLVKLHDSRCHDCKVEYNGKNAAIFHFHHLDQSTKVFSLGNKLTSVGWQRILDECEKCIMICANCHEMRHTEEF